MLKPLSIRSIARSSACGITIEDIQGAVAEQFDVDVVDLKRKSNHHAIVVPRQIAMYLSCASYSGITYQDRSKLRRQTSHDGDVLHPKGCRTALE